MSKPLAYLALLMLLCPAISYAVTVPANIVAYLPITLTNYQSTAVAANTPIAIGTVNSITGNIIGFNALAYQQYETCNLNNGEFFFANGSIAKSWMEGNIINEQTANALCTSSNSPNALSSSANVLYWVLIPTNTFLAANSGTPAQNTLYLGWAGNVMSSANTLFDGVNTGEAPELSCANTNTLTTSGCTAANRYAAYDNGKLVFGANGFYDNFNGSALNLNIWGTGVGASPIVANSMTLTESGSSSSGLPSKSAYNVAGYFIEAMIPFSTAGVDGHDSGVFITPSPIASSDLWTTDWGPNFVFAGLHAGPNVEVVTASGGTTTSNINGGLYAYPVTLSETLSSTSSFNGIFDYGLIASATSTSLIPSFTTANFVLGTNWGGSTSSYITFQWVRQRAIPPNYVLPGTTFGQVTRHLTASAYISNEVLYNANSDTVNAITAGGVGPYTYNFLVYNPNGALAFNALYTGLSSTSNSFTFNLHLASPGRWNVNVIVTNATSQATNSTTFIATAAYLPITLTNYQSTAVAANTPIAIGTVNSITGNVIGFNALAYQQYETCSLNNGIFFFANGTIAKSWMEGNIINEQTANALCTSSLSTNALSASSNVLYWVSIPANTFLPANTGTATTNTVYLGWAGNVVTTENTLMDGSDTGEAPQLTSTYGKYDNGAAIFNLYINFSGVSSSAPSGWTFTGTSGSISINNGITLSPASGESAALYNNLQSNPVGKVLDGFIISNTPNVDKLIGWSTQIPSGTNAGWWGITGNGAFAGVGGGTPPELELVYVNSGSGFNVKGTKNPNAPYVATVTWQSTTATATINYTQEESTGSAATPSSSYPIVYANNGNSIVAQWFRSRINPPNNILPGTTYGTAQISNAFSVPSPSVSNTLVDAGQYITFGGTINGGVPSYTVNIIVSNEISPGILLYSNTLIQNSPTFSTTIQTNSLWTSNSPVVANVFASDSSTNSMSSGYTSNILISPALSTPVLTSNILLPANIETGNVIMFTANVVGGTSPYTYNFIVANVQTGAIISSISVISSLNSNALAYTIPTSVGANSIEANVVVTDSATTNEIANSIYSNTIYTVARPEILSFAYITELLNNRVVIINTATNALVGTINSGFNNPRGIAFSPSGTFGYVTNGGSLSIISTATNSVVGNIYAGVSFPFGVAFSPSGTYAYVTNYDSNNVAIINTATNTVISSITSGLSGPYRVAFSPSGTYAYVTNYNNGNGNVVIVNTASNTVVNSVSGSFNDPVGVAFSPSGTFAYIVGDAPNKLYIVDTATNSLSNTLSPSSFSSPIGVSFSSTLGIAYVVNYNGDVSIFNTTTNSLVGSVSAGVSNPEDVAIVIPAVGLTSSELQASNSVIDAGQTQVITAIVSGGTSPYTYNFLVYGPSGAEVNNALYSDVSLSSNSFAFAQGTGSGTYTVNLIVTDSSSHTMSSTNSIAYTGRNSLTAGAISPQSPAIDNGQSVTLKANPSGGEAPFSYAWYTNSAGNPNCNVANVIAGQTSSTITVTPTTSNTYTYEVTDSATTASTVCSTQDAVTVNPAFTLSSTSVSNAIIDSNQYQTALATVVGGAPPYTYNYFVYNSLGILMSSNSITTSATTNSYTFQQVKSWGAGTFTIMYSITDNDINTVQNSITYTADSFLHPLSFSISNSIPSPPQNDVLTSSISGGAAPYTYNFIIYNALGTVMTNAIYSTSSTSNSFAFLLSSTSAWPTGAYTANVAVSDSASSKGNFLSSLAFVVCPSISMSETPSNAVLDTGQYQVITVNVVGCGGPYTYNYVVYNPSNQLVYNSLFTTSGTLNSIIINANAVGSWTANVQVTDLSSNAVAHKSMAYNVFNVPSVSIAPISETIDSGQQVTLTSTTFNGVQPYSYAWYKGTPAACTTLDIIANAVAPTYTFSPVSSGNYVVLANDSASTAVSTCSAQSSITVNPALSVSGISPSNPAYDVGQEISLSDSWLGGTRPYAANWSIFDYSALQYNSLYSGLSTTSNGITVSSAYLGAGTFNAVLSITDSANTPASSSSANDIITINADPTIVLTPNNALVPINGLATFNAYIRGGTGPYNVELEEPNGTIVYTASGVSAGNVALGPVHLYEGTYTFNAVATDTGTESTYIFNSTNVAVDANGTSSTTTSTQGGGGSGSQSEQLTLLDNLGTKLPSAAPAFIVVANGTRRSYNQDELLVTITAPSPINISFACNIAISTNSYTYHYYVVGLGYGTACNQSTVFYHSGSLQSIYALSLRQPANNSVTTANMTHVSTSNTISNNSSRRTGPGNATKNITKPLNLTNIVKAHVNVTYNKTTTVKFPMYNMTVLLKQNSTLSEPVSISVSNVTGSETQPPGYSKIFTYSLNTLSHTALKTNVTIEYNCLSSNQTIIPFVLENGTWKQIYNATVTKNPCSISFATPNNGTVGIFATNIGSQNSLNSNAAGEAGNSTPIFEIIIAAVVVAGLIAFTLYRRKGRHHGLRK